MDTLFRDIEMPLVFTLFDMEQNGIRVEADALKQYGDQLAGKIAELEKEIYEEAGETFNINSPSSLELYCLENMKLRVGARQRTGYSTAADVLEKLAPEHPVVAKILEYRQYTKLKSTYADGWRIIFRMMGGFMENLTRRLRRPEESAVLNRIFRIFR